MAEDWPDRIQFVVAYVLQAAIAVAVIGALLTSQWLAAATGLAILIISFLPAAIERQFRVHLPIEFSLVVNLFLYASFALGEVRGFYQQIWWWDLLLHSVSALVIGIVGFLIIYVFHMTRRVEIAPIYIAVGTFCFALSFGVLWEIFEFGMDWFFGFNMQKSGLVDTMTDLMVDTVGALLASIAGYIYVRGGDSMIVDRILRRFLERNPHLIRGQ